jgi:hypothetical protein
VLNERILGCLKSDSEGSVTVWRVGKAVGDIAREDLLAFGLGTKEGDTRALTPSVKTKKVLSRNGMLGLR